MNRQLQGHLPVWVRHTSLLMCAVFVHVNVVYAAVEPAKSFWKERKAAADRLAVGAIHESPQPTLLAQIPSDFLPQVSHPAQSIVPVPGLAPSLKPDLKLPSTSLPKWFSAISASHVTLKDLYVPPSWKPGDFMLIHIQDAHGNVEAQQNIARTIESLAVGTGDPEDLKGTHGGAPLLIGIEGARGAFDFHPYQSFPDRDVTKEISDYFIRNGFITGPEYVGMTTKLPITFWGVEDEKPYLDHVQALKDSNPLQKDALKKLEGLSQSLELRKDKELNPALRELDRKIALHRKGQLGLGEFLKHLVSSRLRSNNKFNLRASETSREEFPVIRQFLEALKSEESLDYAKVESERSSLTRSLANELPKSELENLVKASLAYRVGNLTHSAFYKYLKDLCRAYGVQIAKYPEMDKYIRYVLLSETIKQEQLFAEVIEMEAKAIESLITTPQEREVIEASKSLAMSEKLAKYELSPEEWKSYKSSPKTPFLRPFEKFNEAAIARNEILVNNLLNRHSRERGNPLAVLVTGGFHTSGMAELLKSKQVAYAVLTPRLGKVEGSGTDYLSVFTRDKTPLEKLFTGERIQLADQAVGPLSFMGKITPIRLITAVRFFIGYVWTHSGNLFPGQLDRWFLDERIPTVSEVPVLTDQTVTICGNVNGEKNRIWIAKSLLESVSSNNPLVISQPSVPIYDRIFYLLTDKLSVRSLIESLSRRWDSIKVFIHTSFVPELATNEGLKINLGTSFSKKINAESSGGWSQNSPPIGQSAFLDKIKSAEYQLRDFLGPNFRITVDKKIVSDKSLEEMGPLDGWVRFVRFSRLDARYLEKILITQWPQGQTKVTFDGATFDFGGHKAWGQYDDEKKAILACHDPNLDPPLKIVVYHEMAEAVFDKYGWRYAFANIDDKEYLIDALALKILKKTGSRDVQEYEKQFRLRQLMRLKTTQAVSHVPEIIQRIFTAIEFEPVRRTFGMTPELQRLSDDNLPLAALRDVSPDKRPSGYFKKDQFVVLDARANKFVHETTRAPVCVKGVVTNIADGRLSVNLIDDDGGVNDNSVWIEEKNPSIWKWDQRAGPFVPNGKPLRPSRYVTSLGLPEDLISRLIGTTEISVLYADELKKAMDLGLLRKIPGLTPQDIETIKSAFKKTGPSGSWIWLRESLKKIFPSLTDPVYALRIAPWLENLISLALGYSLAAIISHFVPALDLNLLSINSASWLIFFALHIPDAVRPRAPPGIRGQARQNLVPAFIITVLSLLAPALNPFPQFHGIFVGLFTLFVHLSVNRAFRSYTVREEIVTISHKQPPVFRSLAVLLAAAIASHVFLSGRPEFGFAFAAAFVPDFKPYKFIRYLSVKHKRFVALALRKGGSRVTIRSNGTMQANIYEAEILRELPKSSRLPRFIETLHPSELIVNDYTAGKSLRNIIDAERRKGRRVNPGFALTVMIQVAAALAEVHSAGIVHRDVKPGNIIVNRRKRDAVTLIDFNAATWQNETSDYGTQMYRSPEQIGPAQVSPKSDVYGAAIVLCELLTGYIPFIDKASGFDYPNIGLMQRGLTDKDPIFRNIPKSLMQAGIGDVLKGALAYNPDDRPTAEAFAEQLAQVAERAGLASPKHSVLPLIIPALLLLASRLWPEYVQFIFGYSVIALGMSAPFLPKSSLDRWKAIRFINAEPGLQYVIEGDLSYGMNWIELFPNWAAIFGFITNDDGTHTLPDADYVNSRIAKLRRNLRPSITYYDYHQNEGEVPQREFVSKFAYEGKLPFAVDDHNFVHDRSHFHFMTWSVMPAEIVAAARSIAAILLKIEEHTKGSWPNEVRHAKNMIEFIDLGAGLTYVPGELSFHLENNLNLVYDEIETQWERINEELNSVPLDPKLRAELESVQNLFNHEHKLHLRKSHEKFKKEILKKLNFRSSSPWKKLIIPALLLLASRFWPEYFEFLFGAGAAFGAILLPGYPSDPSPSKKSPTLTLKQIVNSRIADCDRYLADPHMTPLNKAKVFFIQGEFQLILTESQKPDTRDNFHERLQELDTQLKPYIDFLNQTTRKFKRSRARNNGARMAGYVLAAVLGSSTLGWAFPQGQFVPPSFVGSDLRPSFLPVMTKDQALAEIQKLGGKPVAADEQGSRAAGIFSNLALWKDERSGKDAQEAWTIQGVRDLVDFFQALDIDSQADSVTVKSGTELLFRYDFTAGKMSGLSADSGIRIFMHPKDSVMFILTPKISIRISQIMRRNEPDFIVYPLAKLSAPQAGRANGFSLLALFSGFIGILGTALRKDGESRAAWQKYLHERHLSGFESLNPLYTPEIKQALLDDPALRPVFLMALPNHAVGPLNALDPKNTELLNEHSVFSVGRPETANRLAAEGAKIVIGVTDRESVDRFSMFGVANNRTAYFPLRDGMWLGVKGCGQFRETEPRTWFLNESRSDFIGLIDQGDALGAAEAQKIFAGKADRWVQFLGSRDLFEAPDENGHLQNLRGLKIRPETSYGASLYFTLVETPHRIAKFPQLVETDPKLERLRKRLARTMNRETLTPEELINTIASNLALSAADKQNAKVMSFTLHEQDFTMLGKHADLGEIMPTAVYAAMRINNIAPEKRTAHENLIADHEFAPQTVITPSYLLSKLYYHAYCRQEEEIFFPNPKKTFTLYWSTYFRNLNDRMLAEWITEGRGSTRELLSAEMKKYEFNYGFNESNAQVVKLIFSLALAEHLRRFPQSSGELPHVLDREGIDRSQFSRIVHPAAGSDLEFAVNLLNFFPNVNEVYFISLGYLHDPIQYMSVLKRTKELEAQFSRINRHIRFHVAPENFFDTRLEPSAEKTLLIDKGFGTNAQDQGNPDYHRALARNSKPGDLILSRPFSVPNLPFSQKIDAQIEIPGHDDFKHFVLYVRSPADEAHLTPQASRAERVTTILSRISMALIAVGIGLAHIGIAAPWSADLNMGGWILAALGGVLAVPEILNSMPQKHLDWLKTASWDEIMLSGLISDDNKGEYPYIIACQSAGDRIKSPVDLWLLISAKTSANRVVLLKRITLWITRMKDAERGRLLLHFDAEKRSAAVKAVNSKIRRAKTHTTEVQRWCGINQPGLDKKDLFLKLEQSREITELQELSTVTELTLPQILGVLKKVYGLDLPKGPAPAKTRETPAKTGPARKAVQYPHSVKKLSEERAAVLERLLVYLAKMKTHFLALEQSGDAELFGKAAANLRQAIRVTSVHFNPYIFDRTMTRSITFQRKIFDEKFVRERSKQISDAIAASEKKIRAFIDNQTDHKTPSKPDLTRPSGSWIWLRESLKKIFPSLTDPVYALRIAPWLENLISLALGYSLAAIISHFVPALNLNLLSINSTSWLIFFALHIPDAVRPRAPPGIRGQARQNLVPAFIITVLSLLTPALNPFQQFPGMFVGLFTLFVHLSVNRTFRSDAVRKESQTQADIPSASPPVTAPEPPSEEQIAEMASRMGTLDKNLYPTVIKFLGIKGGTAVDIGVGRFLDVAQGLISAGIKRVICIDNQAQALVHGQLPDGVEISNQDAFALQLQDGQAKVAVFNESLEWIWLYNNESQTSEVAGKNKREDYSEALEEARRILEPGGWVLIKFGNHAAGYENNWGIRSLEAPLCKKILKKLGFVEIVTISHNQTPVFLWARKPLTIDPPHTGSPWKKFSLDIPGEYGELVRRQTVPEIEEQFGEERDLWPVLESLTAFETRPVKRIDFYHTLAKYFKTADKFFGKSPARNQRLISAVVQVPETYRVQFFEYDASTLLYAIKDGDSFEKAFLNLCRQHPLPPDRPFHTKTFDASAGRFRVNAVQDPAQQETKSADTREEIRILDYRYVRENGPFGAARKSLIHAFEGLPNPSPFTNIASLALQELDLKGKTVIDIGAGDGILSIIAAKMGARVLAVEKPGNIALAEENAHRNNVENQITFIPKTYQDLSGQELEAVEVMVINFPLSSISAALYTLLPRMPKLKSLILAGSHISDGPHSDPKEPLNPYTNAKVFLARQGFVPASNMELSGNKLRYNAVTLERKLGSLHGWFTAARANYKRHFSSRNFLDLPIDDVKPDFAAFNLDGYRSGDKPGPQINFVRYIDDPDFGRVPVVRPGEFIMLDLSAGEEQVLYSPSHVVCTALNIRAESADGRIFIGHAHIHPDPISDKSGVHGRAGEQVQRVLNYVKAQNFSRVEVRLINSGEQMGLPPQDQIRKMVRDRGFTLLDTSPVRWEWAMDTLTTGHFFAAQPFSSDGVDAGDAVIERQDWTSSNELAGYSAFSLLMKLLHSRSSLPAALARFADLLPFAAVSLIIGSITWGLTGSFLAGAGIMGLGFTLIGAYNIRWLRGLGIDPFKRIVYHRAQEQSRAPRHVPKGGIDWITTHWERGPFGGYLFVIKSYNTLISWIVAHPNWARLLGFTYDKAAQTSIMPDAAEIMGRIAALPAGLRPAVNFYDHFEFDGEVLPMEFLTRFGIDGEIPLSGRVNLFMHDRQYFHFMTWSVLPKEIVEPMKRMARFILEVEKKIPASEGDLRKSILNYGVNLIENANLEIYEFGAPAHRQAMIKKDLTHLAQNTGDTWKLIAKRINSASLPLTPEIKHELAEISAMFAQNGNMDLASTAGRYAAEIDAKLSISLTESNLPASMPWLFKAAKRIVPSLTEERWITRHAPWAETSLVSAVYFLSVYLGSNSVLSYTALNLIFGYWGHRHVYKKVDGAWSVLKASPSDRLWLSVKAMGIHSPLLFMHSALAGAALSVLLHWLHNRASLLPLSIPGDKDPPADGAEPQTKQYLKAKAFLAMAASTNEYYTSAAELCEDAIRDGLKKEFLGDAYDCMGQAFFGLSKYPEAIDAFKNAIANGNRSAEVYERLGISCLCMSKLRQEPEMEIMNRLFLGLAALVRAYGMTMRQTESRGITGNQLTALTSMIHRILDLSPSAQINKSRTDAFYKLFYNAAEELKYGDTVPPEEMLILHNAAAVALDDINEILPSKFAVGYIRRILRRHPGMTFDFTSVKSPRVHSTLIHTLAALAVSGTLFFFTLVAALAFPSPSLAQNAEIAVNESASIDQKLKAVEDALKRVTPSDPESYEKYEVSVKDMAGEVNKLKGTLTNTQQDEILSLLSSTSQGSDPAAIDTFYAYFKGFMDKINRYDLISRLKYLTDNDPDTKVREFSSEMLDKYDASNQITSMLQIFPEYVNGTLDSIVLEKTGVTAWAINRSVSFNNDPEAILDDDIDAVIKILEDAKNQVATDGPSPAKILDDLKARAASWKASRAKDEQGRTLRLATLNFTDGSNSRILNITLLCKPDPRDIEQMTVQMDDPSGNSQPIKYTVNEDIEATVTENGIQTAYPTSKSLGGYKNVLKIVRDILERAQSSANIDQSYVIEAALKFADLKLLIDDAPYGHGTADIASDAGPQTVTVIFNHHNLRIQMGSGTGDAEAYDISNIDDPRYNDPLTMTRRGKILKIFTLQDQAFYEHTKEKILKSLTLALAASSDDDKEAFARALRQTTAALRDIPSIRLESQKSGFPKTRGLQLPEGELGYSLSEWFSEHSQFTTEQIAEMLNSSPSVSKFISNAVLAQEIPRLDFASRDRIAELLASGKRSFSVIHTLSESLDGPLFPEQSAAILKAFENPAISDGELPEIILDILDGNLPQAAAALHQRIPHLSVLAALFLNGALFYLLTHSGTAQPLMQMDLFTSTLLGGMILGPIVWFLQFIKKVPMGSINHAPPTRSPSSTIPHPERLLTGSVVSDYERMAGISPKNSDGFEARQERVLRVSELFAGEIAAEESKDYNAKVVSLEVTNGLKEGQLARFAGALANHNPRTPLHVTLYASRQLDKQEQSKIQQAVRAAAQGIDSTAFIIHPEIITGESDPQSIYDSNIQFLAGQGIKGNARIEFMSQTQILFLFKSGGKLNQIIYAILDNALYVRLTPVSDRVKTLEILEKQQ